VEGNFVFENDVACREPLKHASRTITPVTKRYQRVDCHDSPKLNGDAITGVDNSPNEANKVAAAQTSRL